MIENDRCFTTAEEFQRLQQEFQGGEVELAISRSIALQFYTLTSLADIQTRTGRKETAAKLSIYAGLVLTPLLACVCLFLLIHEYGWWAAINIPIAGILWTVVAAFMNPTGQWWTMTTALLIAAAIYLLDLLAAAIALPLLLWTFSLWTNRMTYLAAGIFLTRLVMSSHPAFEMLGDHIEVRRTYPRAA